MPALPLTCPICRAPLNPAERKFLPFCSSRCQVIDLGNWLGQRYAVPAAPDPDEDGSAGSPQQTVRPSNEQDS